MKSYFSLFYLSFFFIAINACKTQPPKATVTFDSEQLAEYERSIEKEIAEGKLPGGEVLIAKNDSVIFHVVKGIKDVTTQAPLQKNSIYFIQSMTKPIISVGMMQLVEKGLVELDDPVSKYIPEASELEVSLDFDDLDRPKAALKNEMTIRQLLSHTAGLTHGLGNHPLDQEVFKSLYGQPMRHDVFPTLEARVQKIMTLPLIGQPGEQWNYSTGPDLVGLIIERVSQQNLSDYLQEHIFIPLGMKDTGYNIPAAEVDRFMAFHLFDENGAIVKSEIQVPPTGNTLFGGTHGLFSTAIDYLQFCQMIVHGGTWNNHQILKPETLAQMGQNQVGDLYKKPGKTFGLGFEINIDTTATESFDSKGQWSWSGYFRTHFFVNPEQQLVGIWMTQMHPYNDDSGDLLKENAYKATQQ